MNRVAVVGGTGFLGGHVVAAIESAGLEALALSRRNGFDALRPDPAAFRGCSAVVNLAGIKGEKGDQTFQAVHVDLVERLAAAMREASVRRLVHVSVVVARPDAGLPYHDTKWKGEEVVRASGLEWTILRPGVIYGKDDDLLSHLAMMIRAAPIFPIVDDGSAPMMPVDARDVASAVVGALRNPASTKRIYDVVGPDRLTLRGVVSRVAEACDLPVSIWPTPAAVMKPPVWVMEKTMRRPLSTGAQLAMLVEGLAGDPGPARRDLGVEPAPFTPERLRPLVAEVTRRAPIDLRLFSAPRPVATTSARAAVGLCAWAAVLFAVVFLFVRDRWSGVVAAASLLAAAAWVLGAARFPRPTALRVLIGLVAASAHYAGALGGVALLSVAWPGWEAWAREFYSWPMGHPVAYLAATLTAGIFAEEVFWRGLVARFAMERLGRPGGIAVGAALFAAVHVASLNPLLVTVAFLCGLFWNWLYAATDDLTAPFVAHLAWDVTLLFVFRLV